MGLFDFFRRKPAIRDVAELADFIDQRAAFLVQKGMYDYARARSGPHAKWLLGEAEFQERIDKSRWRAYPMGLAMVGEMVDGMLYPFADGDRRGLLERLSAVVMDVRPLPGAGRSRPAKVAGSARAIAATSQPDRDASAEAGNRYPGAICRHLFWPDAIRQGFPH